MAGKHVALLVEDEPEMAAELADFLDSLGHAHVHAATQEEALALLREREFCYALVDLQIKVGPDSIKPRVEAGQTLLEVLRQRFPGRNDEDEHALQVLVMSGHAKEHQYVVRAFQAGANDFITKPLSDNQPPVAEKIRAALERSGRDGHGGCVALTRAATTRATADAASDPDAPHLEPGQQAVLELLQASAGAFLSEREIEQKARVKNVRAVVAALRARGFPVESAREARRRDRGVSVDAKGYRYRPQA